MVIELTEKEERAKRRRKSAFKRRRLKKLASIVIHKNTKVELKKKRDLIIKEVRKEINASIIEAT